MNITDDGNGTGWLSATDLTPAQRKLVGCKTPCAKAITDEEFKVIQDLRNNAVKVVPHYDIRISPKPDDIVMPDPVTDPDIAAISAELHQFDAEQQLVLDRIMKLEADPPPATKPLPAPPSVEYLVDLVKLLHSSQKALLGRLVALEQGRKFHPVKDLVHPFED